MLDILNDKKTSYIKKEKQCSYVKKEKEEHLFTVKEATDYINKMVEDKNVKNGHFRETMFKLIAFKGINIKPIAEEYVRISKENMLTLREYEYGKAFKEANLYLLSESKNGN